MRKLIFSIPGFAIAYEIIKAISAIIGIIAIVKYGFSGVEGVRLAMAYVILVIIGFCMVWIVIYTIRIRSRAQGQINGLRFDISDEGKVTYNDLPPKVDFDNLTEGEITRLLKKYPVSKFHGKDWNQFRGKLLSARKTYKGFMQEGNVIKW